VTADSTLTSIGAVLDDWERGPDAARSSPDVFPCLGALHKAAVGRLCARTGMDGYAATLIVADTAQWGHLSPWRDVVAEVAPIDPVPIGLAHLVEALRPLTVTMQQFAAAMAGMAEIGKAIARALGPMSTLAAEMSNPPKPVPLCIDGHAYHRRQLNRRKRKKR